MHPQDSAAPAALSTRPARILTPFVDYELTAAIMASIERAKRTVENMALAGEGPESMIAAEEFERAEAEGDAIEVVGVYDQLAAQLRDALTEILLLRDHRHDWDYGETETSAVRCRICGADGLA